jgi:hypothetical protein
LHLQPALTCVRAHSPGRASAYSVRSGHTALLVAGGASFRTHGAHLAAGAIVSTA